MMDQIVYMDILVFQKLPWFTFLGSINTTIFFDGKKCRFQELKNLEVGRVLSVEKI